MNTKISKNYSPSSTSSTSTKDFVIILIKYEYDTVEGYGSLSEDSVDSSEIINSSDEELEITKINEIYKTA